MLLTVVLAVIPVFALCLFAWSESSESLEILIRSNNYAAADSAASDLESKMSQRMIVAQTFASLPAVVNDVMRNDKEAARERLRTLVSNDPRINRAFIADAKGTMWSDFPFAPESQGVNFSGRDWYKGVSASWQPYVSRVYRRHAAPAPLLIAVAAPVKSPAGDVIGILVYQILLEALSDQFKDINVGSNGFVMVLDYAGTVAAHPRIDPQSKMHESFLSEDAVKRVGDSERATLEYRDPILAETMLATFQKVSIAGHDWIIIAQQPVAHAYAPLHALRWQILIAGILLAGCAGTLAVVLEHGRHRTRALNRDLATINVRLRNEMAQREQAQEALQRSKEELERRVEERTNQLRSKEEQLLQAQKMEAVGRLAGGVAHDFNNLLTAIMGFSELSLTDKTLPGHVRQYIEQVKVAGTRATDLTRQLLAFSRKQVLQPVTADLNAILRSTDKLLQRLIREDIDLVFVLAGELDPVYVDPGQMGLVLVNLVVNARDAMPRGGKIVIETANCLLDAKYAADHSEVTPGEYVMLAVSDTGTGMDKDTLSKIFEPFFTTKEVGKGTGLGLAMIHGIVKQSGGHIWAYSEPGKGSTFKVYLPRSLSEEPRQNAPEVLPAPMRGNETILLVEDEALVRDFATLALTSQGYTVLAASSAEMALELAHDYGPLVRLMVTDVVMPGMSGTELARKLTARFPGLRVLFMSGYTENAIVHHGVLANGINFLQKPLSATALCAKVRQVLDGANEQPKE
ncbi:MAG: ATP-binding protein [Planctomycetes bacterium]|nr:ATP-binding protein [Planctomycetota bacterium]